MLAQDEILVISAVRNRFGYLDAPRESHKPQYLLLALWQPVWDFLGIYGRHLLAVNARDIVEDRGRGIIRKIVK